MVYKREDNLGHNLLPMCRIVVVKGAIYYHFNKFDEVVELNKKIEGVAKVKV